MPSSTSVVYLLTAAVRAEAARCRVYGVPFDEEGPVASPPPPPHFVCACEARSSITSSSISAAFADFTLAARADLAAAAAPDAAACAAITAVCAAAVAADACSTAASACVEAAADAAVAACTSTLATVQR